MNASKTKLQLTVLTAALVIGALTGCLVAQSARHAAGSAHLGKSVVLVADGVSPAPPPPPPPRR